MGHTKSLQPMDLALGGGIQMAEAATLGMPFEVWKTRMGRYRNESTIQSFKQVYKNGGVSAFWQGLGPKMVESASKGAVLLFAKDFLRSSAIDNGFSQTASGFLGGAGGGIAQVSVMGPCTFLVTALVTQPKGQEKKSVASIVKNTWKGQGIKGFYPGGTAIAARQASNWASRQGFTDMTRGAMRSYYHGGDSKAKLTRTQEVASGMFGGAISCWNHPFEVARIEMQSRAAQNEAKITMPQVFKLVIKEHGLAGLFKGVIPRLGLGMWQTLFMVTFAQMAKDALTGENEES